MASAVLLLVVVSVMGAYSAYLRHGLLAVERVQAALLLEEGMEALRVMRDNGYTTYISTLSTSTAYRFSFDTTYHATTTATLIDSTFDRTFRLSDVYRDTAGNIVSSGGVYDPGTKKAAVSVSWKTSSGTTTKSISTYLINLFLE